MKELLDEHLQEEEQKKTRWWEKRVFYIYQRLYWRTFAVAGCMLLFLFFRNTLHIKEFIGSDLDAILALIALWAIMAHLFYKISQHVLTGCIMATILIFGVFLNYAPSVVATIHGTNYRDVTRWRWSHYELVFGKNIRFWSKPSVNTIPPDIAILSKQPPTLETNIIECTEWFLFYILLTTITAEILGLGNRKK